MLLQVSPVEMAGAVTDLLKAAGMPLDLERQQLLQQSLAMQQQVKDAQTELAKQVQVIILCHRPTALQALLALVDR